MSEYLFTYTTALQKPWLSCSLLYPQQPVQCLGHGSLFTNRLKEAFKRWVLGSILLLIMSWHPYCKSKKYSPVDSRESGMGDRARWWKSSGSTAVPGRGRWECFCSRWEFRLRTLKVLHHFKVTWFCTSIKFMKNRALNSPLTKAVVMCGWHWKVRGWPATMLLHV